MKKLLKYWNQNKRKILITIAVIALVIVIIQMANAMIRSQNEQEKNQNIISSPVADDITKPNQSVISDEKLTEEETRDNSSFIEQFVNYCNQKEIESAYNMLSDDCKAELYLSQEIFANNYVNQIFQTPVNYELELWYTAFKYYTYRITYHQGNLLQTGGKTSSSNFMDYITLVKKNGEYKLNINKFISKETLSKQGSNSGIEVQLNSKSIYVDYEIYHMTVQNNTQKTILLNDGTSSNNFTITGKNSSTFTSVISEVPMSSFTLNPQYRKTIDIKFNKIYMTASKVEAMEMKNIYLDKAQYDAKQENPEKVNIRIEL